MPVQCAERPDPIELSAPPHRPRAPQHRAVVAHKITFLLEGAYELLLERSEQIVEKRPLGNRLGCWHPREGIRVVHGTAPVIVPGSFISISGRMTGAGSFTWRQYSDVPGAALCSHARCKTAWRFVRRQQSVSGTPISQFYPIIPNTIRFADEGRHQGRSASRFIRTNSS